jgi:arylsulfatase A-like enzyme
VKTTVRRDHHGATTLERSGETMAVERGPRAGFGWILRASALIGAVLAATAGDVARAAERQPNIVVIVSDDAGYHEFSMHGSTTFATPRIDSIAAGGVRFTNGYVSGCVCSPTRAGLLTGRYQTRFGHEFNFPPQMSEVNGLSLDETTLADVLQGAGYRTIALGKWHLGYAAKFHPLERGFTDYYGFLQGQRSYFPLEQPTVLNRMLRDREPVEEKFDYLTDELGRAAAEYIGRHKEGAFFLYLAFNATHGPRHAAPADLEQAGGAGAEKVLRAMTSALDRSVGTVLDALDEHGLTKDTLVVFVNDNGGATGHDNAPLRDRKGSTWEGGIRVPFAVRWPGRIAAGQVVDAPVISLDVFPTAMAAAGVEKTPGKPLDGVDLVRLVATPPEDRPRRTLYWRSGPKWAVRDGDLKVVAGNAGPRQGRTAAMATPALFDLAADPGEKNDLAATRPADVARLQALFEAWSAEQASPTWRAGAEPAEINDAAAR